VSRGLYSRWVLVGVAVFGAALLGVSFLLEWLSVWCTEMPWGSVLSGHGGGYYYARLDVGPGIVQEGALIPVGRERFEKRLRLEIASGVAAGTGVLLLVGAHTAFLLRLLWRNGLWLLPETREGRFVAAAYGVVMALLAASIPIGFIMGARTTGTRVYSDLTVADGKYYVAHHTGPLAAKTLVPISAEQYDTRREYEEGAQRRGAIVLIAALPLGLYGAYKGNVYYWRKWTRGRGS